MKKEEPTIITTREAGELLGASARQVSNLIRSGRLIGRSFGKENIRHHYVLASSVRDFLAREQNGEGGCRVHAS